MKYMLKKIFIGVAIGIILYMFKTSGVFAYTYSYNEFSSVIVNYSFDICVLQNDNLLCQDGFSDTQNLKTLTSNTELYTTTENQYLMLKDFSVEYDFNTVQNISQNIFTFARPTTFLSGMSRDNLAFNQSLVGVNMVFSDDSDDNGTLYTNGVGIYNDYLNISQWRNSRPIFLWNQNTISKRNISKIRIFFQSGYNYNGSLSNLIQQVSTSGISSYSQLVNKYKNNTYLAYLPPNTTLVLNSYKNSSSSADMTTWNSYSSSYYVANNYSPNSNAINESLSELEKEFILTDSISGSVINDDVSNNFDGLLTTLLENTDFFNGLALDSSNNTFMNFLGSLFLQPITHIQTSLNNDIYQNNSLSTSLCFHLHQEGVSDVGWIRLWPKHRYDGQYADDYYMFQMPCMINFYSSLRYGNYVMLSPADTGTSFYYFWVVVQHAMLYYWYIVTLLHIFKYTIENSKAEIEVIEL